MTDIHAKYCKYCGASLTSFPIINNKCPICGAEGELGPYCSKCGASIDLQSAANYGNETGQKRTRKKIGSVNNKHKGKAIIICVVLSLLISVMLILGGLMGIWHLPIIPQSVSSNKPKRTDNEEKSVLYTPDIDSVIHDKTEDIYYVNNIVLIFFTQGTSEQEIQRIIKGIDGTIVGSLPIINQYQVKVKEQSLEELKQLCSDLKKEDCIEDAIFDQAFPMDGDNIPNDPWEKKWFQKEGWSEETPDGSNWWAEAIQMQSAWDLAVTLPSIKIGIVDNGFDTGHEDLKNRIKYTSLTNNKSEHGTHVAGIIGAEPNNKKGITGVAWNCELYTYDWEESFIQKIVDKFGGVNWNTFNQILGGVVILREKGATIINISAGQSSSMSGQSRPKNAIDYNGHYSSLYLNQLLSNGYDTVIVQSAGNGNSNDCSVDAINNGLFASINKDNCYENTKYKYKDIFDRVIIVGAAQHDGAQNYSQPSWSNAGDRVDICAPGDEIYSTVPGGLSGKYKRLSGTSMATPIVTGIAALVWSNNKNLTGADVKSIVCDSANTKYDVADNTSSKHPLNNSYRLVNAHLALQASSDYSSSKGTEVLQSATQNGNNPGVSDDLIIDKEAIQNMDLIAESVIYHCIDDEIDSWNPDTSNLEYYWDVMCFYSNFSSYNEDSTLNYSQKEDYYIVPDQVLKNVSFACFKDFNGIIPRIDTDIWRAAYNDSNSKLLIIGDSGIKDFKLESYTCNEDDSVDAIYSVLFWGDEEDESADYYKIHYILNSHDKEASQESIYHFTVDSVSILNNIDTIGEETQKDLLQWNEAVLTGWAGAGRLATLKYDDAEQELEYLLQTYGKGKAAVKGTYEIVSDFDIWEEGDGYSSSFSMASNAFRTENQSDIGLVYAASGDYNGDGIADIISFRTEEEMNENGDSWIYWYGQLYQCGKKSSSFIFSDLMNNESEVSFLLANHYLIKVNREYEGGNVWPISEKEIDDYDLTFYETIEVQDLDDSLKIVFSSTREVGNYFPDDYNYKLEIPGNRYYWNLDYSTSDNVALHEISDESEIIRIIEEKLEDLVGEHVLTLSSLRWENRWSAMSFSNPASVLQIKMNVEPADIKDVEDDNKKVGSGSFTIKTKVPSRSTE